MEVDVKEGFDVKTGSFKEEEMNQIGVRRSLEFGDRRKAIWLGMMRIRCSSKSLIPFPNLLVQEGLALGCPAFPSGSTDFGGLEVAGRQMAQGAKKID